MILGASNIGNGMNLVEYVWKTIEKIIYINRYVNDKPGTGPNFSRIIRGAITLGEALLPIGYRRKKRVDQLWSLSTCGQELQPPLDQAMLLARVT